MNNAFYQKAREAIGGLYVWGGQGHAATETYLRSRAAKYPQYFNGGRLEMMLRRAKDNPALRCWDCSGLVNWSLDELDLVKYGFDTTAHGLYANYCTPVTKDALQTGDLLFRKSGSKMVHVGIYAPGACVEAAGGAYGVIETPGLTGKDHRAKSYVDGKTYQLPDWTHYGRLNVFAQSKPTTPEVKPQTPQEGPRANVATILKITAPLMRSNEIGVLQHALNGLGYPCGLSDGIFGQKTMKAVRDFAAAHLEE